MPDRMEMLREASERLAAAEKRVEAMNSWDQVGAVLKEEREARKDFETQAVNFVRDLLSGTWPDQEAVERGGDACMDVMDRHMREQDEFYASKPPWREQIDTEEYRKFRPMLDEAIRAALTAALGLTVLERG